MSVTSARNCGFWASSSSMARSDDEAATTLYPPSLRVSSAKCWTIASSSTSRIISKSSKVPPFAASPLKRGVSSNQRNCSARSKGATGSDWRRALHRPAGADWRGQSLPAMTRPPTKAAQVRSAIQLQPPPCARPMRAWPASSALCTAQSARWLSSYRPWTQQPVRPESLCLGHSYATPLRTVTTKHPKGTTAIVKRDQWGSKGASTHSQVLAPLAPKAAN